VKGVKAKDIKVPGAVLASGSLQEIGNTLVATGGKYYVNTFLLDPISVTKSNLQVPVQAGFYSDAEAAQLK